MPEFLEHQPGLLFVGATLLPLASFVLIGAAYLARAKRRQEGKAR